MANDDWDARLARLRERATTLQFPIDHDIRAALERVEARDRRIAFMEGIDDRKDSGWCGEHPRMFSLRPDAEADGECLMCANDALRQRVGELTRERDEARAEVERLNGIWEKAEHRCPQCGTPNESLRRAESEVARLEGLILDAFEFARIKPGNPNDAWLALLSKVGRIRAGREEGR